MPRTRIPVVHTTPGDRVRIARVAAGLTQVELAAAVGLHQVTICKVETGRYPLSVGAAIRIAEATKVAPSVLLPYILGDGAARCPHCGKPITKVEFNQYKNS